MMPEYPTFTDMKFRFTEKARHLQVELLFEDKVIHLESFLFTKDAKKLSDELKLAIKELDSFVGLDYDGENK